MTDSANLTHHTHFPPPIRFSESSVNLLKEVYSGLMLPLPQCINSNSSSEGEGSETDTLVPGIDILVSDTENRADNEKPASHPPSESLEMFLPEEEESVPQKK